MLTKPTPSDMPVHLGRAGGCDGRYRRPAGLPPGSADSVALVRLGGHRGSCPRLLGGVGRCASARRSPTIGFPMTVLVRLVLGAAALVLLTSLAVGFAPIRVPPVGHDQTQTPSRAERGDCGTVFSPTQWPGDDDACERANTGNLILMMLLGFLGVCLGLVALVLQIARSFRFRRQRRVTSS